MKKLFISFSVLLLILLFVVRPIFADVAVSATVPPRTSDFQFNFASDGQTTVPQNTTLSYTITYGAALSAAIPTDTTIVVDFSDDQAPDASNILNYVIGSATNAYNNTPPVVDPTHKTITWTISNLPSGTTDQAVTFKLRTVTSYNKSNLIQFTVHAAMSNQYLTLPQQSLTQIYQYNAPPTSQAQPTAIPTGNITPTPTPTPSLSPITSSSITNAVTNVSLTGMTGSQATIQTTTATPTKLTILYGTTPTNLSKRFVSSNYTRRHKTDISGLSANTTYYFKISTTDSSGYTTTSDTFTFHTANRSPLPNLENNIIVLSSNGNVFASGTQKESDLRNPSIILTNDTDDTIAYTLTNPIPVKTIDLVVINKVLGAHSSISGQTTPSAPGELIFPMQKKTPTLYVANLTTIPQGSYDVAVRITDANGNIIQKHISDLKIMPRLIIYGADTHTPLADARVYISYYDAQTRSYQPVTSALFGNIKNPSYTDSQGQSAINLPAGTYRIEESSLFYDPQTQNFTIGSGNDENFPVLYLKKDPFNLVSLFTYTTDYFLDSWTKMTAVLIEVASSVRIFHLVDLVILATFVGLTFFFFLFRTHLEMRHLPIFSLFHLNHLLKHHQSGYIFGHIVDAHHTPISRVRVEIEDAHTAMILSHGSSHRSGKFYFTNLYTKPINLVFIKEGYEPTTITLHPQDEIPETGLQITMEQGEAHHLTVLSSFIVGLEQGFGMLFETFIVSSFILELFFIFFLPHEKTLPFYFILSIVNGILWIFYRNEQRIKQLS